MFRVTLEFINDNMSPRGGWTRDQLAAIGVPWPPLKGWKIRSVGTLIDDDQVKRFCVLKPSEYIKNLDRTAVSLD